MLDLAWPAQLAIAGTIVVAVLGGVVFILRELRALQRARSTRPPPPLRPAAPSFAGDSGAYPDPFASINKRLDTIDAEARETQANLHEVAKTIAAISESLRWFHRVTDRVDVLERRVAALPRSRVRTPPPIPKVGG